MAVKAHWVAIPFFVKVDPRVVKNNEPHKIEEIGWFTIDNLPEPLHSGFAYSFESARLFRKIFEGLIDMLTVKTSVRQSDIEGMGLFAEEKISKGTAVWKYDPRFNIPFDVQEVEKLPILQKELVQRYAYLSTESGKYIYCIDDARFCREISITLNQLFL